MRTFFSVVVSAAFLLCGRAFAYEFVPISGDSASVMYVDPDSVRASPSYISAWVMTKRVSPFKGSLSDKVLWRFDCDTVSAGVVNIVSYRDRNGSEPLPSHPAPRDVEMSPIPPGSVGADLISAACYVHENGTLKGYSDSSDLYLEVLEREAAEDVNDPGLPARRCKRARGWERFESETGEILLAVRFLGEERALTDCRVGTE